MNPQDNCLFCKHCFPFSEEATKACKHCKVNESAQRPIRNNWKIHPDIQDYADQQTLDFTNWLIENYVQSVYDNKFYLADGEGGWTVEELLTKFKENEPK